MRARHAAACMAARRRDAGASTSRGCPRPASSVDRRRMHSIAARASRGVAWDHARQPARHVSHSRLLANPRSDTPSLRHPPAPGPPRHRRVADELRRHCLNDNEGGQYSTNLDRNRYGNDDQYLSTVIRYDLEYLDLCPCLVDVEIIDAKNGNESTLVSAGPDMCICEGTGRKVGIGDLGGLCVWEASGRWAS